MTGVNFGCGSSREHAPWALEDFGFRVIIAKSFADIFRGNAPKTGLLPVGLARGRGRLRGRAGRGRVDLESQEVRAGGKTFSFEFAAESKRRLLNGLDDISVTLGSEDKISAYEAERERTGPDTLTVRMTRDWDGATYDRISAPQEEWARVTLDRLELTVDETVLDAGCGSGRVTRLLLDRLPRGRVLAVDAAPSMVEEAADNLDDRATVWQSDLLELEVPEQVDAAFSNAVFHWVPDHEALFARLHAALRPGGSAGGPVRRARQHRALPRPRTRGGRAGARTPSTWAAGRARGTSPAPRRRVSGCEAAGFREVQTWLEESPVRPPEPRELPPRRVSGPPPRGAARGSARAVHARRRWSAAASRWSWTTCG